MQGLILKKMEYRKRLFAQFIYRFKANCQNESFLNSSEETIRTWINEMLGIFGWNVQDTNQVLQESTLNKEQRIKLLSIGSHNVRPDYTFVNGKVKIAFLDAKSLSVDIYNDKEVAFQIKSYGWSIGADYSIVTNVKEFAVYDCTNIPNINDESSFGRLYYIGIDDFASRFDVFDEFLFRENVINHNYTVNPLTKTPLDTYFADFLSKVRLELVKSVKSNNPKLRFDTNAITFFVQIIIDRVLFIRVCEARGLEQDNLLLSYLNSGSFWECFKKSSYLEFYDHYDGPMFKRIKEIHNLNIPNDVFDYFLRYLYYPSPYRFDVIPLKTLSDIYDKFLGYSVFLDTDENVYLKLKEEYQKSKGAVTTPEYIVDKVVSQTIREDFLANLTIDEIFNIKIVDPSCGSGVFLVGAYERLYSAIVEKLSIVDVLPDYAVRIGNVVVLTIEGKRNLINNCIYGVDIDPNSVEVAKMSLSLKMIDDYLPYSYNEVGLYGHQILNGVGDTIRCGNSIVESDILQLCPNIKNSVYELTQTRIFDWKQQFKSIFDKGGFDFIVGNPPYVEVKNYNTDLKEMASYVKLKYDSCKRGKVDLAIPFIERSMSLLKQGGRLGFIVQKRFFKTEYGYRIREFIRQNGLLSQIHEYSETDIFKNRITYVANLILENSINNTFDYSSSSNDQLFKMNYNCLDNDMWILSDPVLTQIRTDLSFRLGNLGSLFKIKVGIQVLCNDAYHIRVEKIENNLIYGKSKLDENVCLELEACRPLVCNESFVSLSKINYNTFAIFPYDIDNFGNAQPVLFSDFCVRYPFAGQYLLKHKQNIVDNVQTLPYLRKNLKKDEYWHLYTREQNLNTVLPKVVVPMTSIYPSVAVVSDNGVYCDNANVNFIDCDDPIVQYAIAGIISSKLFGVFAKYGAIELQNGYSKYNKEYLGAVPFPVNVFKTNSPYINQLSELAKRKEDLLETIKYSISEDRNSLLFLLEDIDNQIENICRVIYGISNNDQYNYIISKY